jgi:hypothetical protein
MNATLTFFAWCILVAISWPLAVLALFLLPVVWLIALPFRMLGIVVSASFAFLKALLFLPARALGAR